MAKSFSNLKDPKLGLTDKLTFGKFKDCRICDLIEDQYDYLIWIEKEGYVKYQQIVVETIQETANFAKWEAPVEDTKDLFGMPVYADPSWELDVPF